MYKQKPRNFGYRFNSGEILFAKHKRKAFFPSKRIRQEKWIRYDNQKKNKSREQLGIV